MDSNYTSIAAVENTTRIIHEVMVNQRVTSTPCMTVKQRVTSTPCINCDCNTTQAEPSSDSLSVNGGFIAMAAGLSVVVPLICVLIMQLRRAKMEERERERRRTVSGGENGVVDPPPSYEQVFGGNYPVLPVHSRNSSMDALIDENETSRPSSGTSSGQREAYVVIRRPSSVDIIDGSISVSSHVPQHGTGSNPAFSDAPVATISGSQVADLPVSVIIQQTGTPIGNISSNISMQESTTLNSSSQIIRVSNNSHFIQTSNPSLAPSTSASTSLSPPPSPPPALPLTNPPPLSSWIIPNSTSNRNNSTGTSAIHETLRRFPGMHISIEDFFASLRGLQENEGPPPSYEEALKILESAALAKERKNIIK